MTYQPDPEDEAWWNAQLTEAAAESLRKYPVTNLNLVLQAKERMYEATPPRGDTTLPPVASSNPKQAYGDLKCAVHLVPPALVIGAAKAMKEGAIKYGAYNWRKTKVEAMTYVGGALRHLLAYLDGEDVDPESTTGKLHLEGVAACIAIALDAHYGGFMIDNRPPKGPAPMLVRTPVTK